MGKIEKLTKIDFESKPVYGDNDKYTKIKIKIYAGSMITNFYNKEMTKEKTPCKCLSIIMLYWWRFRKTDDETESNIDNDKNDE